MPCLVRFQSTLPRGERLDSNSNKVMSVSVSIHAPAWGATAALAIILADTSCFNPRSRVGSDATGGYVRPENIRFNPRSRVGSDSLGQLLLSHSQRVSIHAPAWGATC